MSANGGRDYKPLKACPTTSTSANDMVVSDDDSATGQKKTTSCPPLDNSSYSGSDDETIIETDQPLFLDAPTPVRKSCGDNVDPILGSDVGAAGEDAAMMAEFLQDTFESNATGCGSNQPAAASTTFGDVLDASEMDALLNASNDALMLLPDLGLEC